MTVFSKVDLRKAFYLVPLDLESQSKTITLTNWGTYKYKRMPMGLRNSAQTFQKLIDHVVGGLEHCYAYMDDILVFSKTQAENLSAVNELFQRLSDNGLAVHLAKCEFGRESIDFLGYRVTPQGVAPLPKKVQAIVDFPPPKKP